ncbi:MAG TPA: molybdopterin cofactor-binding domain-containing protein [Cyclobacteriaceae bacterium]|nr:molybdopterin cofactor-binding domain-containing protein [Cyclobacteriaceae bacterium]
MNRRNFIVSSIAVGGGLLLKFENSLGANADSEIGNFLRVSSNGDVIFHFVKHEMGQGVSTAMAQIISEELCADWSRVKIDLPLADMKKYNANFDTGGSCTIIYQWDLLRQAGAMARQMLIQAAAQQWNTTPENCYAENHMVINRQSSRKIGFGQLASAAAKLNPPKEVKLKTSKEYNIIGKRKKAILVPEIVTGSLQYGIDVKLPGMLYAQIERCPVFKGKLKSFDATNALKVEGVKQVFTTKPIAGLQTLTPYMPHDIREGVVVVADSFWAAKKGREALIIEWDEGVNGNLSTEDFEKLAQQRAMHRTDPTGYTGDENAVSNVDHVRKTLRAQYVFPHQLHSCMEPLNCTAHANPDGCEIWMGSQAPNLIVTELARNFQWKEENIKVHLFTSGGGFGRRYYPDMAFEAAYISKIAGNIPVKMMWTREDEHRCNLGHMFQHMEYQAALDKDGKLYAWYEKELRTYTWAARYHDPALPTMAYEIPNVRFDFEDLIADELVHSSAWRGVIIHGRAYAECFVDEIAADQKKDPYEFRLSMLSKDRDVHVGDGNFLSSKRMRNVLMLACSKAGWGKPMSAGRGMGICLYPYGGSYVCTVAEITVTNEKVKVDRVTVALDCGLVINPLGVENQVTGGIVWSLTALFHGGMPIKNGRVMHSNFHQNKLLRMDECPEMEVHFVETNDEKPGGVGEISSPMAVPAVLNAIYAATGKRIRKVPISLQDIIPG